MNGHSGDKPARQCVLVVGETLIDVTRTHENQPLLCFPGGSPYNVAIGLARLGTSVRFAGRISSNVWGHILRGHAEASGVDLSLTVPAAEPNAVALVEIDAAGVARYCFDIEGTADFAWTPEELARLPHTAAAVHFGSLASWLEPGGPRLTETMARLSAAGVLVSYDPNVRPQLLPDHRAARRLIEQSVATAWLVKSSAEDLSYLYPSADIVSAALEWLRLGPEVVIVTEGARGAFALTASGSAARVSGVPVSVVDTVGAGDAFTAGVLDALITRCSSAPVLSREALISAPWTAVLQHAAVVAGLTCGHAGADPPSRREVEASSQSGYSAIAASLGG